MSVKRIRRTLSSAILGIAVSLCFAQLAAAQDTYVITKSTPAPGASLYHVAKDGVSAAPPSTSIQGAIDGIKYAAKGNPCTIQFGNGTVLLDIGEGWIEFEGGANGTDWGLITLTGKLTSANAIGLYGTIALGNGVSVNSAADVTNTADGGTAFGLRSTGLITISGGTVSATTGSAIRNSSNGTVIVTGGMVKATTGVAVHNVSTGSATISGGTVSATVGNAVHNNSTGSVTITGGTVSATTGKAIYSSDRGKITISGAAKVTSANTNPSSGTIHIVPGDTPAEVALVIENGTVENTAESKDSRAIYNASTGAVTIETGRVSAYDGITIFNGSTGALNISDGWIATSEGIAIFNSSTGKITISGNALVRSSVSSASIRTIVLGGDDPSTAERLLIEGGTVVNQSSNPDASAIFNTSAGSVTIRDQGTVLARNGYAVYKDGKGKTVLNGGLVFAYGADSSDVVYGGYTKNGPVLVVAWNKAAGNTRYEKSSMTDIFLAYSDMMTAVWDNWKDGSKDDGIYVFFGSSNATYYEKFIEIPGVKVTAPVAVRTPGRVNSASPAQFVQASGHTLHLRFADRGNVAIYSIKGAKVRAFDLGSGAHTLRMDGLPRGAYMVRAVSGSWGQSVRMLVK